MLRKSIFLLSIFMMATIYLLQIDQRCSKPIQRTGKRPDKPDGAAAWFYDQRANPYGIPLDALFQAKQYIKNQMSHESYLLNQNMLGWTPLGPSNIGGRVRTIVIHPTNTNVMYTAGVAGGIWKTTNSGMSWTSLDDFMTNLAVCTMVLDPNNSEIIYAGTGEGYYNVDAIRGAGIFKTTNAGLSWTQLPSTANDNFAFVNNLAPHPENSDTLLAATRSGLWRSLDGGNTWTLVESGGLTAVKALDVIFHPTNPQIVLAAFGSFYSDGIYRSTDGGANWQKITSNLPINSGRISLAISPSHPNIVYASIANKSDNTLLGLYKSSDAGVTWELVNQGLIIDYLSYGRNGTSGQGWYDHIIKVHPSDTNTIYAGGIDLYKSTDGGDTFFEISHWYGGYGYPYVHADQHEIMFMPGNSNTIFVGNDGGIFKTTNGGNSWASLNSNLAITQFYSGASAPNANYFIGGTQDNGTLKYTGSGMYWSEAYGGDGGCTAVNYLNTNIVYTEYVHLDIKKSTNSGVPDSWFSATNGINETERNNRALFIAPFVMDPNDPNILYAGTNRLYRTTDGAGIWEPISNDLTNGKCISAIAVSKFLPQAIYTGSSDGKVFRSFDSGSTWVDISSGLPAGRYVTRIAVNQTNHLKVYVTYSGYNTAEHIYRTENGGDSWTNISNNLPDIPVNTIVINPLNPNILYVGTDLGVFESVNDGLSWTSANTGLANVVVHELFLKPNGEDFNLVAATHGRGMYITNSFIVPIELSLFTANLLENNVVLNWRTESEFCNSHFEVERKTGETQFRKLAIVKGAGTTSIPQEYSYTDNSITNDEILYYRIKQVDTNGSFLYSHELKVDVKLEFPNYVVWQNYPNPFNEHTMIRYQIPESDHVDIKLFDSVGREVMTLHDGYQQRGIHRVEFNGNALPSGVYFYRLSSGRFTTSQKLILMK